MEINGRVLDGDSWTLETARSRELGVICVISSGRNDELIADFRIGTVERSGGELEHRERPQ